VLEFPLALDGLRDRLANVEKVADLAVVVANDPSLLGGTWGNTPGEVSPMNRGPFIEGGVSAWA